MDKRNKNRMIGRCFRCNLPDCEIYLNGILIQWHCPACSGTGLSEAKIVFWRNPESAPKDGTIILGLFHDGIISIKWYEGWLNTITGHHMISQLLQAWMPVI